MSSVSEHLRKEGNQLYLAAIRDGLSPFLAKDRLLRAIKYYCQAKTSAEDNLGVSSSLKNIGKAHYQMSRIKSEELRTPNFQRTHTERDKQKVEDEVKYHAKESLNELFASLECGRGSQSTAWCDKMDSDIGNVFSDVVTYVSFGNFDRRVAAMFVIAGCMVWDEMKALLFVQIATILHQHSVNAVEIQDFRTSLRAVHEMNYPLEEAGRFTDSEELKTDIRVMRADSLYQLATAESMRAISVARQQLSSFLQDVEFLNMNMVFDTLDMFKDAALKAREINLEQEAIACHYQGHIFEKILKLKQKAKTFYLQVMQLTEAAKPKLFNGEEWYDDCTASLKAMQDEARERDEREQEAAKQKLRKELETELNKIEEAKTAGAVELLKHVYSKHPPKNKPSKLDIAELDKWDDIDNKSKKRLLLKALSDFHPDKNPKADFGEKWHFLVGEISRKITHFHDCEKNLLRNNSGTNNGTRDEDKDDGGDEEDGDECDGCGECDGYDDDDWSTCSEYDDDDEDDDDGDEDDSEDEDDDNDGDDSKSEHSDGDGGDGGDNDNDDDGGDNHSKCSDSDNDVDDDDSDAANVEDHDGDGDGVHDNVHGPADGSDGDNDDGGDCGADWDGDCFYCG